MLFLLYRPIFINMRMKKPEIFAFWDFSFWKLLIRVKFRFQFELNRCSTVSIWFILNIRFVILHVSTWYWITQNIAQDSTVSRVLICKILGTFGGFAPWTPVRAVPWTRWGAYSAPKPSTTFWLNRAAPRPNCFRRAWVRKLALSHIDIARFKHIQKCNYLARVYWIQSHHEQCGA